MISFFFLQILFIFFFLTSDRDRREMQIAIYICIPFTPSVDPHILSQLPPSLSLSHGTWCRVVVVCIVRKGWWVRLWGGVEVAEIFLELHTGPEGGHHQPQQAFFSRLGLLSSLSLLLCFTVSLSLSTALCMKKKKFDNVCTALRKLMYTHTPTHTHTQTLSNTFDKL